MRTVTAGVAFAIALAAACAPRSQPVLQFLDGGGMDWMQQQANGQGVRLDLSGIHAIDNRTAFVFGDLGVSAGTLRSVLLRTADGGASWQETLTPITGSEVDLVAFADSEHGWAIAHWTVEGPGAPVLYRSDDGGRTWTELVEIASPQSNHSSAHSMTFSDRFNGEIRMGYWTFESEPVGAAVLATTDGGATWQTVRRMAMDETPDPMKARFGATGQDGTAWELDIGRLYGPTAVIRRGRQSPSRWDFEITLPTRFSYGDGRALGPRDP